MPIRLNNTLVPGIPGLVHRFLCILVALAVTACAPPTGKQLQQMSSFTVARVHGRFVTIGDTDVFAITRGSGRDVVLLHGSPASTYSWRKIIEPLAEHVRVHAIDLPGFGFSEKPDDAEYGTGWLARIVIGYLDEAGVEQAVLVGNSTGGHVASEAAILYPTRVSGLVLLASSGLRLRGGTTPPPLAFRIATWPIIGPLLRAIPPRSIIRDALEKAVFDPSAITDADIDAYYLPLRTRNGLSAFVQRTVEPDEDRSRDQAVATIRAPTLVIAGDGDRVLPRAISERYHELIPGSRFLVMERTGHLPQEEQPERTAEEILSLVRELG